MFPQNIIRWSKALRHVCVTLFVAVFVVAVSVSWFYPDAVPGLPLQKALDVLTQIAGLS